MKNNKKLNDGCLKIFEFIKLLYEDKAEYDKVLEIFKDGTKETPKENIQVTLNRYINTLKVFGLKVEKENTKYKIQNSLYAINLTNEDLKAISILMSYVQNFPDNKISIQVQDLLNKVELRMKSEDKNTLNSLLSNNNYDFGFYYANIREQIAQCEKICAERFMINIMYLKNNKQIQCKGVLKEIIYGCKNVSLRIYDTVNHINIEIPINNVLSIVRLPQIASDIEMSTTVVYKLKNRLAKTYKLKENEYSDGYNENGELIVINKNESFDKLIQRLMRYTDSCEIISPKNLRDEMIQILNDTISNYALDENK